MRNLALATMIAGSALVAACGDKTGDAASGDNAPAATLTDGWKKPDACAVLDKAVYGQAISKTVSAAVLGMPHESDGTTAATSECAYAVDGEGRFTVMLRWSPINDNTEGAINTARNGLQQVMKAFGGTVETLPGVGKAAYWVERTSSLNVFIGEDRMAIINVPGSAAAKDQAVAIARKLGA